MQTGAFLAEIENVCSSSEEANNTAKQTNEKCPKQSGLSAMVLNLQ